MNKNITWVAHQVISTDTLDKLALTYYNNPTYWWVIAYFNDIQDAFIHLKDYLQFLIFCFYHYLLKLVEQILLIIVVYLQQ